jgi:hypothetical protein
MVGSDGKWVVDPEIKHEGDARTTFLSISIRVHNHAANFANFLKQEARAKSWHRLRFGAEVPNIPA